MRPRRRDRTNKSVVRELADVIEQIPGVQLILKIDSGVGAREWSVHAMLDPSQLGWAALKNLTSALRDPSGADGHVGLRCQELFTDGALAVTVSSVSACGVEPETAIEWLSGSRETGGQADDEDATRGLDS